MICRCGNRGCLETVASSAAVADLLERSRHEPVSLAQLLALLEAGDLGARPAVADAGRTVGRAVAGMVNVLNPELVIIGGELAKAGDTPPHPLRAAVAQHALLGGGRGRPHRARAVGSAISGRAGPRARRCSWPTRSKRCAAVSDDLSARAPAS